MPTLADVVRELESIYDPAWAESWDAVGLVCGDPAAEVRKILFAVDPVAAVADEAIEWGADLIVTHHPLYLRGVTSVAATTFKGRLIHKLIKNDVGLFTAHTNADVADPGVSDALARAVGLTGPLTPLQPSADDPRRGLGRVGELSAPVSRSPSSPGGRRTGCPPRRAASGSPETPTAGSSGSPSAGERATPCSVRPAPPEWTCSSPRTCATTRPPSSWRPPAVPR